MRFVYSLLPALALLQPEAQNPTIQAEQPFRPIARVVNLLKEMQRQLEKEKTEDAELHEKMTCWCSTNEKAKTTALDTYARNIERLTSDIESYSAKSGQLSQEIKDLASDIEKNNESLAEVVELRKKERAEFTTEEQDMAETIKALEGAVKSLSGVHGEGSEEEVAASFVQLRATIKRITTPSLYREVMQKDLWDALGTFDDVKPKEVLSAAQVMREMFLAPVKPHNVGFVQQPGAVAAKSYNSRSGQIYGMLKQMKEEFENKHTDATKEEQAARVTFAQLKKSLNAEIAAATTSKNSKTSELGETNQNNARAKAELNNTREDQSTDSKFLADLQAQCATADSEYAKRQETRADEIKAVGETIGVLTEDSAREVMSRTMSFLQASGTSTAIRLRASSGIALLAKKHGNYQLALLAIQLKRDAFTKVKKAMDDMLAQLRTQQQDEYEHREYCTKELDTNENNIANKKRHKSSVESTIQDLKNFLGTTSNDIDALKATISELQTGMKRAGEDRAAENKEFQQTVADQRATKQILDKALKRLEQFYQPNAGQQKPAVFVQNTPGMSVNNQGAPAQARYEKHGSSTGVLSLLREIIADADRMEQEALRDEQEAQTAYSTFVTNTNMSIRNHQKTIVAKSEAKAQGEVDLSENNSDLSATNGNLETLNNLNAQLHQSCDFVLKNFNTRQQARQEEVEAIEEAKAILSGADFGK
eukprot:GEMP01013465.1.p1 GENE.GEMP01013465.1~~GEMP01013465.1.p1  ORF type:complete len:708 (+),score=209.37 GEMP01013465.1:52-2175(+)